MVANNKKDKAKKNQNSALEDTLYTLFLPLTKNLKSPDFEKKLLQADIADDIDIYFSKHLFIAFFILFLILFFGTFLLAATNNVSSISILLIVSVVIFFGYLIYAIVNPYMIIAKKVNNIKANLALVIISMSSVAESGAPPEAMFTASSTKKYTAINKEFTKIRYYLDSLGISLLEAIDLAAKETPSFELKKFLLDLKSNIESGGSLPEFMKKKAEHEKFEYNLRLNTQNKKAELFGDIYSAVVVAGPLFLFLGVMLLGIVGGNFGGLSVQSVMILGIFFLVPIVNIGFIALMNVFG